MLSIYIYRTNSYFEIDIQNSKVTELDEPPKMDEGKCSLKDLFIKALIQICNGENEDEEHGISAEFLVLLQPTNSIAANNNIIR